MNRQNAYMYKDLKTKDGAGASDVMAPTDRLKRSIGRCMAVVMATLGAMAAGVALLALSSCTLDDDDNAPSSDWYISGVWQNNSSVDETMTFHSDGSGHWQSGATGSYLDFDYYCFGNSIYFTMYPTGAPSYNLDCYIDMIDSGNMSITWPPSSPYGSTTIYYTRVD